MWHQALQIVSGQAPNWVQVVLLYAIALSVVFDVALTILLAFVVPDIINSAWLEQQTPESAAAAVAIASRRTTCAGLPLRPTNHLPPIIHPAHHHRLLPFPVAAPPLALPPAPLQP